MLCGYLFYLFFDQVDREKRNSIGYISSRPISIDSVKTILLIGLNSAYDENALLKAGPILFMHDATAEIFVSKSNLPSNETMINAEKKSTINSAK